MVIQGKEIDFKIFNKRHAKNFDDALKEMGEAEKKIKSMDQTDLVGMLDALIAMFRRFFITATGVDVLEACEDAAEAKAAYLEFLDAVKEQKAAFMGPFDPRRIK